MNKKIIFENYVPSNEQQIITEAIEKIIKMGERHNIPVHILQKPLYVLYKQIEGYAMIQPLIGGNADIIGHRLYLNSDYIFEESVLERLVAHEVLHTFSSKNILRHEALKFKSISLDYEVTYNKRITHLTEQDVLYIESRMKI